MSPETCTLTISRYQSYTAVVGILLVIALKLLHSHSPPGCAAELEAASKSFEVLEFCSGHDPLALKFFLSVRNHYDMLRTAVGERGYSTADSIPAPRQDWGPLLDYDAGGSPLHKTARELCAIFCTPFADAGSMVKEREDGVGGADDPPAWPVPELGKGLLGLHLDWACAGMGGDDRPCSGHAQNYYIGNTMARVVGWNGVEGNANECMAGEDEV